MIDLKNKVVTRVTLFADSSVCNRPAFIYAKQYDSNSRYIIATIKSFTGEIPLSGSARLNAKKPDGTVCYIEGDINDDNTITIQLSKQLLAVPGEISCDISVYENSDGDNGTKLTTSTFFIIVGEATYNEDAIESEDDYGVFFSQSDWNQTDNTKLDFIKNKPDFEKIESAIFDYTIEETTNAINVMEDGKKYAQINSFGGKTYKKGASGGGNLLPYPYVSIKSGLTEVMGIVSFDNIDNPYISFADSSNPYLLKAGTYKFCQMGSGVILPRLSISGVDADGANKDYWYLGDIAQITIEKDITLTEFYFGGDDHTSTKTTGKIIPVLYNVEDYPDGFEFEPRYYNLDDTKVKQIIVRGANLLPVDYPRCKRGASVTIQGITYTVDNDGRVTANGTCTAQEGSYSTFRLNTAPDTLTNANMGHHTISGCPEGGSTSTYYISNVYTGGADTGSGFSVNVTKANYLVCDIRIMSGVTVNDLVFEPMLNKGSTKLPFTAAIEPNTTAVPDSIKTIDGYGAGLEGYPNVVDLDNDRFDTHSKTIVLTGEESYGFYGTDGDVTLRGVSVLNVLDGNYNRQFGICSHFDVDTSSTTAGSIRIGASSDAIYFYEILDILGFNSGDNTTDVETFKAWVKSQYDAGHPVTIIYKTDFHTSEALPAIMDSLVEVKKGHTIEFISDTGGDIPVSVKFIQVPEHLANKLYVQSISNTKVSKYTGQSGLARVYGVDGVNQETVYAIATNDASSRSGNITRFRDSNSGEAPVRGYLVSNTPVNDYQVANKVYVDNELATLDPNKFVSKVSYGGTQVYVSNNGTQGSIQISSGSVTPTDGRSGAVIPLREADGNLLAPTVEILNEGNYFTSHAKVEDMIANIMQGTIYGTDVAANGSLNSAIKSDDYGLFVVSGDNVTVTFTGNDSNISVKSNFHFFIKYKSTGNTNKIIHLYLTSVLQGYVKSFDGTLSSDISVSNGSTQYGARVIKMKMKSVTT